MRRTGRQTAVGSMRHVDDGTCSVRASAVRLGTCWYARLSLWRRGVLVRDFYSNGYRREMTAMYLASRVQSWVTAKRFRRHDCWYGPVWFGWLMWWEAGGLVVELPARLTKIENAVISF